MRVPLPDPMDNVSPDSKKSSENEKKLNHVNQVNSSNNYHSQNTLKPQTSESQIDITESVAAQPYSITPPKVINPFPIKVSSSLKNIQNNNSNTPIAKTISATNGFIEELPTSESTALFSSKNNHPIHNAARSLVPYAQSQGDTRKLHFEESANVVQKLPKAVGNGKVVENGVNGVFNRKDIFMAQYKQNMLDKEISTSSSLNMNSNSNSILSGRQDSELDKLKGLKELQNKLNGFEKNKEMTTKV